MPQQSAHALLVAMHANVGMQHCLAKTHNRAHDPKRSAPAGALHGGGQHAAARLAGGGHPGK